MLLLCALGLAAAPAVAAPSDASLCRAAVLTAETLHAIPRGLLLAIAEVETGRPTEPWPWSVNADNRPQFFATRQDAVAWTTQALQRGVASIDTGCLQVNLQQHPRAFASVDQAFDPGANADYAARYLAQLYRQTGTWPAAVGAYHSHTPSLAGPYQARVGAAFVQTVMQRREEILAQMAAAWSATRSAPTACDAYGNAARKLAASCAP